MNLHIVPDSKFIDTFYKNLNSIDLLNNNRFVVSTIKQKLNYITYDLPFARLYTSQFMKLTGDTRAYDKVVIHQFSPLMYRWVATNNFKNLSWCIWGGDLYHLPGISSDVYEKRTWSEFVQKQFSLKDLLYKSKVYLTNLPFRGTAYGKVLNVLTWMETEYQYATRHLPSLSASHQFFFYENAIPYHALDDAKAEFLEKNGQRQKDKFLLILGNSGTETNNHIDALEEISKTSLSADIIIPVSYGNESYVRFLKKNIGFYKNGNVTFLDKFMDFSAYLNLLLSADGLVMNHRRPQGYGNIFLMMYLGKPVFLNPENFSIEDLNRHRLQWHSIKSIKDLPSLSQHDNAAAIRDLLSHERLLNIYQALFG
jgi:dTDP-N-acetylfucosamine:lipid II N-acetylfucosaminyltransferase